MTTLLLGLGAPTLVTAAQMWLKFASRTRSSPHQPWRSLFTRDDFTWWVDWIVTASVALAAFLLNAAARADATTSGITFEQANQSFSGLLLLLLFILVSGLSVLPTFVNRFGYDYPEVDGGIVQPTLRVWRGIVIPNIVGVLVLSAVVVTGVIGGSVA